MRKSVSNSPRLLELRRKQRRVLMRKILLFAFCFLLLFAGLTYLSRWEKINIENIVISGNKVVETQKIEEAVLAKISGNYLWFFPKANFLIYPKGGIKKELTGQFKRLSSVSMQVKEFKTLEISVSEYEAKYTWCGDALPAEDGAEKEKEGKCQFMDSKGYVFDEAPYFSGNVYFRFYGKLQNFDKLIQLKENMEKMGLMPVSLFYKDDGDINIYLSAGGEIRLKSDADFEKVAENLQAALSTEPLKSEFKNKQSSLLYIDLRFGNKVYYKFR